MRRTGEHLDDPASKYLSAWLQVATKGLCDDAKARIYDEISAHFQDALEQGVRAGLAEDVAGHRAVDSLGSPRNARRAFRRAHLTKSQQATIAQYSAPRRLVSVGFTLMTLVVLWQSVLIRSRWVAPDRGFRVVAAVGMVIALVALVSLVPRWFRHGNPSIAFLAGATANLTWWSCALIALTGTLTSVTWLFPIFALAPVSYAPLVRKLRNDRRHPA
jgi:hypothetical protein